MASSASIFKQKLKETAGLANKTVDPDVAKALERLAKIEKDVVLLKRVIMTANEAVMIHAGRARLQMTEVVSAMAESLVVGAASEHYGKFKSVHEYMDTVLPAKLTELFEKAVIKPLDDWATALTELRAGAAEFETFRVKYDHYKDKFVQLQEEKRQTQMKGKVFPKDAEERLARNEEKLKEAEEQYTQIRDGFLARCCVVFEQSGHNMDHVLLRVMQYEKQVYADCASCTKAFEPHCTSLLGYGKDWKAVQAGGDRFGFFVRMIRETREKGGRLEYVEMPITTVPGTGPTPGSYERPPSAGAGAAPFKPSPAAGGPAKAAPAAAGGWDAGFGAEAEASPDHGFASAPAAGRGAPKPSPASPGNPFGAGASAGASGGSTGAAEAFHAPKATAGSGLPPRAPSGSDAGAAAAAPSASAGDARKPSPGAGAASAAAASVGGLFGKAKGLFGGAGNPFGSSSAAKDAHASSGGRLDDEEDSGAVDNSPVNKQPEPASAARKAAPAAAAALPDAGRADHMAMSSSTGGWDDFPAPAPAPAPARAAAAPAGGFEADPWGAAAPAPAQAAKITPRLAPAATSGGHGFEDPWNQPAAAPAPAAGLKRPSVGAPQAHGQGGQAGAFAFGGFDDAFGAAAPAPAPAKPAAASAGFGGAEFGSFDAFTSGNAGGWGAPSPAPAPAPAQGGHFDPFGGL